MRALFLLRGSGQGLQGIEQAARIAIGIAHQALRGCTVQRGHGIQGTRFGNQLRERLFA